MEIGDRKKVVRWVLIAIGALILILLLIPLFINANSFRPTVEARLSDALGRRVQVGDLSMSIFSGSLSAKDLSIADDRSFSNNPFLTAKGLRVGVEVWPLITSKALHITGLTIEKPEVDLVRNQQGKWNISTLGNNTGSQPKQGASAPQAVPDFEVAKLELEDGSATVSGMG